MFVVSISVTINVEFLPVFLMCSVFSLVMILLGMCGVYFLVFESDKKNQEQKPQSQPKPIEKLIEKVDECCVCKPQPQPKREPKVYDGVIISDDKFNETKRRPSYIDMIESIYRDLKNLD